MLDTSSRKFTSICQEFENSPDEEIFQKLNKKQYNLIILFGKTTLHFFRLP